MNTLSKNLISEIVNILLNIYTHNIKNKNLKRYDEFYEIIEYNDILNNFTYFINIYKVDIFELIIFYIYVKKYYELFTNKVINLYNISYLITIIIILERKMYSEYNDIYYSNKHYSLRGYLDLSMLNDYEIKLFKCLNLNITYEEYSDVIKTFKHTELV